MKQFFETAAMQNHPLRVLATFMEREEANEKAKKYTDMRFVGYVLDIGYDTITIITSDPFKIAVGGIPRNSLLIMAPAKFDSLPPHFTLLRVLESAPTPLSREVQQTYFELQKKSMPELDVFTQSELQWGALKTAVLGMFYPHPDKTDEVEFSGDVNNFVSAHKYRVYAPCDDLLNLIVNTLVRPEGRFKIGNLRLTECRLPLPGKPSPKVEVNVSTVDFMGCRTAMFGKTRLGKSNVVKLIAQSLIETQPNVGQLIFDINGEYANDNPQDNNRSLASGLIRKIQIYWAVLFKAGFTPDEPALKEKAPRCKVASKFDPGFKKTLRAAMYGANPPTAPNSLATLVQELEAANRYRRTAPANDPNLKSSSSGDALFGADEIALLEFLEPPPGRAGISLILPFRQYHDPNAGHFIEEILDLIDRGMTVILDLGNANPQVMQYFSNALSLAVFNHQVDKFSNNELGDHFVQLCFEEAHNLFPRDEGAKGVTTIYARFAKEGAKYHIGMVYSTQSPTTINKDLLAQTENFFIAHLSSRDEVVALGKLNVAYDNMQDDILCAKTPGYIRMLTRSHRFVVPVQVRLFSPLAAGAAPAPAAAPGGQP